MLFIFLLVLANLLYGYNYVNAYINSKQTMLATVADQLQKRIETYRFVTYQVYDNLSASNSVQLPSPINEIRLRPDIYLLEKSRHKTAALIFGQHDASPSDLALRMS
ncbi:MAG: phosphotransferase RcsD, partial [Enterobacterales bacterium]|nr:phosphotransferase RcsD [Enterobacterales bacterium]